ncbi:MAG: crossover junction endodeoxyribonuclease RuvC [Armatimonadetes bacterium]|nr:crossover junction endodeoxyribonuclease RuvC [Armatimonadota bacterium]
MRIMGVDTGLAETGYGVVDAGEGGCRIVEAGVISTGADEPLEQRLRRIYRALSDVISEFEVQCAVIEDIYAKYRHPRTAIMMGHARGVIILAAADHGIEVHSYPASLVKKSLTGSGRASKEQVRGMVARALKLHGDMGPSHVTDALALALCHAEPARGGRRLPAAVEKALRNKGGAR